MSPLSTIAVSIAGVRALGAVAAPASAAASNFLDLLRPDDDSAVAATEMDAIETDLDARRQDIIHRLRSLLAALAGNPPTGSPMADSMRVELSALQHVYVEGDGPLERNLEAAIERDADLLETLRQWFRDSGQQSLQLDP